MIDFTVEMMGRSARLSDIELPAGIKQKIAPVKEAIEKVLVSRIDDDEILQIVFHIDEDRRLTILLKGSEVAVNKARDIIGEHASIREIDIQ